jgi:hypothetical protein
MYRFERAKYECKQYMYIYVTLYDNHMQFKTKRNIKLVYETRAIVVYIQHQYNVMRFRIY